ncbi:recombinase family protein [Lysinibacillus xylanilyticus]
MKAATNGDLHRLARSTKELYTLTEQFKEKELNSFQYNMLV